jgi:hypothetical protein
MKRKRKFADGGGIPGLEVPGIGEPVPPPGKAIGIGGSQQGTARSGLDMVGGGAKTIGNALDNIQSSLGSSQGSGTSPGGIGEIFDRMSGKYKRGGKVQPKGYASGGRVGTASKRGDGIAKKGKTKGTFV